MTTLHPVEELQTYHVSFKSFDDTLELSIDDLDAVEIFEYDIADHTWFFFDEAQPGHLAGFTLRAATRQMHRAEIKSEFQQILGDEAVVALRGMIRRRRSHTQALEIPLTQDKVSALQDARLALRQRLSTYKAETAESAYSFSYSAEADTLDMKLEHNNPENCFSGEVSEGFRLYFDADKPGRLVGLSISKASEFFAAIKSAKQLTMILGLEEVRALRNLISDLAAYGDDDAFVMGYPYDPTVERALKTNLRNLHKRLLDQQNVS